MLSSLQQDSIVYIVEKTDNIKFLVGRVVSKSEPRLEFNHTNINLQQQLYFDIEVRAEEQTYKFEHINGNLQYVNYADGTIVISDTKEALIPTIETMLHNSKTVLNNIDFHKQAVKDCEDILKQLNPKYAKEVQRDESIEKLESRVNNIDDKLTKIFELLNNNKND